MSLVGKKAPEFRAKAVWNGRVFADFSLEDFKGKYVVFFFYPLDFTFVCPTEIHAFQERLHDFEQAGAQVVGCSVDSCFSHLAWLGTAKSKGGIEGICYPLVSDLNRSISKSFGVLNEEEGIAYRGLFLLDREGIVRHQVINDFPLGRCVNEELRMVQALSFHEQHGEVCPANWCSGEKAMVPTEEGLVSYFSCKK